MPQFTRRAILEPSEFLNINDREVLAYAIHRNHVGSDMSAPSSARLAADLAWVQPGNRIAARIAMKAITTGNSKRVKARRLLVCEPREA